MCIKEPKPNEQITKNGGTNLRCHSVRSTVAVSVFIFVRACCIFLKQCSNTVVFLSQLSTDEIKRLVAKIRPDMAFSTNVLERTHGYEISNTRREHRILLVHGTSSSDTV